MSDKKNECMNAVDKFFDIYKDNDYMLQRIYNHIVVNLPNTLENECKNYEKRVNLNTYLSEEQQIFMQVFLSKNNYYYLSNNNFFYEYNGKDYLIVKEDDIIHKLLSNISKDRVLLQWKHKTKMNVIKQIKERNLFSSIPETDTIQNVFENLNCNKGINFDTNRVIDDAIVLKCDCTDNLRMSGSVSEYINDLSLYRIQF
jgi:hypothetical protein